MPPRDVDAEAEVETAHETDQSAVEATDAETREQALRHLQAALSAAEPDAKQFHIRQALQLLDIERR